MTGKHTHTHRRSLYNYNCSLLCTFTLSPVTTVLHIHLCLLPSLCRPSLTHKDTLTDWADWSCPLDRPWYTSCAAGRAHANTASACNLDLESLKQADRGRGDRGWGERDRRGGSSTEIIYISWTSQLVSVFTGGRSGSNSCLLMLGLCHPTPLPFPSPPSPAEPNRRSDSGSLRAFSTPNERDAAVYLQAAVFIWYNMPKCDNCVILTVRTRRINKNPTGWHVRVRR